MDFDGIARKWANSQSFSSPAILADLLDYDTGQLGDLRVFVSRYTQLAHAVELIDVLTAFRLAKQQLDDARRATQRMADLAAQLALDAAGVPGMAVASVERAVHAQEAAHLALDKARSGHEKVRAAVVLELADAAAAKALDAAEAAEHLTHALSDLVRATQPVDIEHLDPGREAEASSPGSGLQ